MGHGGSIIRHHRMFSVQYAQFHPISVPKRRPVRPFPWSPRAQSALTIALYSGRCLGSKVWENDWDMA